MRVKSPEMGTVLRGLVGLTKEIHKVDFKRGYEREEISLPLPSAGKC